MDTDDFRRLVLKMPGAVEGAHVGHPDFRVGKKIFAALDYPKAGWAMVRLSLDQRARLTNAQPNVFSAVPGGWGKHGATLICLQAGDETTVAPAIEMAWINLQA